METGSKLINESYQQAAELQLSEGVRTISIDEKTGIQALERQEADLPMKPGKVHRREFEYTRHGTQCLIANFDVVTGRIENPTIGATRNEEDFVGHIKSLLDSDPSTKQWRLIVDNLNTHQSEGLVRLIAQCCNITEDLGIKGQSGILKSMESRSAFLSDPAHDVRFIYTPKHCSWLNQVEMWFSILQKKLLRRLNSKSLQYLKERILEFIAYFNDTMAKPFQWGKNKKPLNAK